MVPVQLSGLLQPRLSQPPAVAVVLAELEPRQVTLHVRLLQKTRGGGASVVRGGGLGWGGGVSGQRVG